MNNEIQQQIKQFFRYFDHALDMALKIEQHTCSDLFKVLIFSGIIDTLAKCCTNPGEGNAQRFKKFIKHFCDWKESSKVSLPHLVGFVQLAPSPEFENLRKFAYEEIAKWDENETIVLDRDPDYQTIFNLWPKDMRQQPIDSLKLENLTHLHLLWQLRNSVVHEMRILGYGIGKFFDDSPGYHIMKNLDNKDEHQTWELVYPVNFFKKLIRAGIKNLENYCKNNKLNPMDRFEFGSFWLEKLNEKIP